MVMIDSGREKKRTVNIIRRVKWEKYSPVLETGYVLS